MKPGTLEPLGGFWGWSQICVPSVCSPPWFLYVSVFNMFLNIREMTRGWEKSEDLISSDGPFYCLFLSWYFVIPALKVTQWTWERQVPYLPLLISKLCSDILTCLPTCFWWREVWLYPHHGESCESSIDRAFSQWEKPWISIGFLENMSWLSEISIDIPSSWWYHHVSWFFMVTIHGCLMLKPLVDPTFWMPWILGFPAPRTSTVGSKAWGWQLGICS